MKWSERYSGDEAPDMPAIAAFIASPLWEELCAHLQSEYGVTPSVQYSTCPGAPGWNVKYRKGGRALCTLYPDDGFFTCLVALGNREAVEAELLLPFCTEDVQALYQNGKPVNGTHWLMIPVTSPQLLRDVKRLVALRAPKKRA